MNKIWSTLDRGSAMFQLSCKVNTLEQIHFLNFSCFFYTKVAVLCIAHFALLCRHFLAPPEGPGTRGTPGVNLGGQPWGSGGDSKAI